MYVSMMRSIYDCAGFAMTDDITVDGVQIRADGVGVSHQDCAGGNTHS